jgi:hypothetical protein
MLEEVSGKNVIKNETFDGFRKMFERFLRFSEKRKSI